MYLQLEEKQYNKLENILCPEGSWLFPDKLGGMLARKISRFMGWPVARGAAKTVKIVGYWHRPGGTAGAGPMMCCGVSGTVIL